MVSLAVLLTPPPPPNLSMATLRAFERRMIAQVNAAGKNSDPSASVWPQANQPPNAGGSINLSA